MLRRILIISLFLLPLILAGVLAAGWWYMAAGRFPLAGSLRHDFGVVEVGDGDASMSHTFHLVNETRRPLVIIDAKPSCSCTTATLSTNVVEPGGALDVDVTLTLSRASRRKTHVKLIIEDSPIQSLWVQADGRRAVAFRLDQFQLRLKRGEPRSLVVHAERPTSDDPPDEPVLEAPPGVTAVFKGWDLVEERDLDEGRAARWLGRVEVELVGERGKGLVQLHISMGGLRRSVILTEEE